MQRVAQSGQEFLGQTCMFLLVVGDRIRFRYAPNRDCYVTRTHINSIFLMTVMASKKPVMFKSVAEPLAERRQLKARHSRQNAFGTQRYRRNIAYPIRHILDS